MKYAVQGLLLALLLSFLPLPAQASDAELSEFMASNGGSLADEDGDFSDWIEVHNTTGGAINLAGWSLTDNAGNLTKWVFPDTPLAANGYLVVFASEKDRDTPGQELHANFRLGAGGEYLALVEPDGTTIATEYSPAYPVQVEEVSYGLARIASSDIVLIPESAPVKAFKPVDASLEPLEPDPEAIRPWTQVVLDDSAWSSGATGVGWDLGGIYNPLFGLVMPPGGNATLYVRVPFTVADPSALAGLTLRLRYEDGIVVYLNGAEVYRDNILGNPDLPTWNSEAAANRLNATTPIDIDITSQIDFLQVGDNVLSVQGLNRFAGGSDLLVYPELLASGDSGLREPRYFTSPSPGAANSQGTATIGPVITEEEHIPNVPTSADNIVVRANVRDALGEVNNVTLRYRVMFGAEVAVSMLDDGLSGDDGTGDGIYGATIPSSTIASPGQMVRWYITASDTLGNTSRVPPYEVPAQSPQYIGTVVNNPNLTNPLPVLHMFIENYAAAATDQGTRCSLFYLDQFYDNLNINIHGQSSRGFNKHSFDVDFHRGHNFEWKKGELRADDINLLTTYPDKSHMRNMLAWETYAESDSPYHYVVPVRVERNGVFEGTWHIVENGDENWLERLEEIGMDGMSPRGALYKMYETFTTTAHTVAPGAEKKSRKEEGNADLLAMFNAMGAANNSAALKNYVYDNINLPQTITHLAGRVVIGDIDCCHKNYYFYRDTEGTGEWQMLPWDLDLSFGRLWNSTDTYWDEELHPDRGAGTGGNNRVPQRIFGTTEWNQMYYRRLRTMFDEHLNMPGTPESELVYERKIEQFKALIGPDAAPDLVKWGTFGNGAQTSTCCVQSLAEAADEIADVYLPARRQYVYNNIGLLPAAQPADVVVTFGAVDFDPVSGNQEEEYLVLHNGNNIAVDISGWRLTNGVEHTFRGGVVIPSNMDLYVAKNVNAWRARASGVRGGQGLFVRGGYEGQLSARGETVQLVDKTGRIVSQLSYPGLPSPAQSFLRITELMYHPPAGSGIHSSGLYEYVELRNIGASPLNLSGVHFTNGISFNFSDGSVPSLGAGERVLVVRDLAAFEERYGTGLNVAGVYAGSLDNAGERIELNTASNERILDFSYNNSWYPVTDGLGFSLVISNDTALFSTWDQKESWRPSGVDGGSPGTDDSPLALMAGVLVNEVLAHTDPPNQDTIELYNPGPGSVDIGGWYITDDLGDPKKFQIPSPMMVAAGAHVIFDEGDFNDPPAAPGSFLFSSTGDEAYIFSADAAGNLTGYYHGYSFGASANGVSFGPHVNSLGREEFVAMSTFTPGAGNDGPRVGPVVFSEISYHPVDLRSGVDLIDNRVDEYIELQNITGSPVELFDPAHPANTWRLTGDVDLAFGAGVTLPPGGHALLVPFNPENNAVALAAFRAKHGVDPGIPIMGPLSANLPNAGASLRISRPDSPDPGNGSVPYIRVDRVDYSDELPWPIAADGLGPVLQRVDPGAYGDEPENWVGAAGNPGQAFVPGVPPMITQQPQDLVAVAFNDALFSVEVSGPGPFSYQWRFNGSNLLGETNAMLLLQNVQPSQAGSYQVAVISASGSASSSNAILTVAVPASITFAPQSVSVGPGTNVTFQVVAESPTPITYQWRHRGVPIPGETNSVLNLSDVVFGVDDGVYDVVVTDGVGSVASPPAVLTILVRPEFIVRPQGQVVPEGSTVTLWVQTTGTLPMGYKWRRGGLAVKIEESVHSHISFLTITNFSAGNAGNYSVVATNEAFYTPGVISTPFASITLGVAIVDTDMDGLSDDYENANELNPNDPADAASDGDGDDFSALQESLAGTDPNDILSFPKLTAISVGSETHISFEAKAGKTYTIQYTDTLHPPVWFKLTDAVPVLVDGVVEVIDPAPPIGVDRFYRFVTPREE